MSFAWRDLGNLTMSSFDEVVAACPKCSRTVRFQSKAGDCRLTRYRAAKVPPEIAKDLAGRQAVCECGETITLELEQPLAPVRMVLTVAGDSDVAK